MLGQHRMFHTLEQAQLRLLRGQLYSQMRSSCCKHSSGAVPSLLTKPQVSVKYVHFYQVPVTSPQSLIHVIDSHVAQIICVGNLTSSSVKPTKFRLAAVANKRSPVPQIQSVPREMRS